MDSTALIRLAAAVALLPAAVHAQAPVQSFTTTLTNHTNGQSVTIDYQRYSIRSPHYEVLIQQPNGSYQPLANPDVWRTYLGTVQGNSGAWAAATVLPDGTIWQVVAFEDGVQWMSSGGGTTYGIRGNTNWTPRWPTTGNVGSGGAGGRIYQATTGVEAPNFVLARLGPTNQLRATRIEHEILVGNLAYLHDTGLVNTVGRIILRGDAAADPYAALNGDHIHYLIGTHWNAEQTSAVRVNTAGLTNAGGGKAWVNQAGSGGYSSSGVNNNGEFHVVWRHEVGHSWGAYDMEAGGPEGPTIESGNSLTRFSGPERARIITRRDAILNQLTDTGPFALPLPPSAALDLGQAIVGSSTSLMLDVQDNDHDANANSFGIVSFQASTNLGGTVTRSVGSGPGGRDQLLYRPPSSATQSLDSFTYRLQDSTGRTGTGNVFIELAGVATDPGANEGQGPWAQWSFSDNRLRRTTDASVHGFSGLASQVEAIGNGLYGAGFVGNGTRFVELGTAPSLSGTTDFTLSAWIKTSHSGSIQMIAQQRSTAISGVTDGYNGEYMFSLDAQGRPDIVVYNGGYQFDFNGSTAVNDGQWHRVAFVRQGNTGRLYVDGVQVGSQSGQGSSGSLVAAIPTYIGRDQRDNKSGFIGQIDDFTVWRRALGSAELQASIPGLRRQVWLNITGGSVSSLTSNPNYPANPDLDHYLESPDYANYGDNYGVRLSGWFTPPVSGSYRFSVASDDSSSLRLSTDANPANAVQVASVSGWVDEDSWSANPSQQSAARNLVAGQSYFVEILHKEGGGGDHLSLGWSLNGAAYSLVPGAYLSPVAPAAAPNPDADGDGLLDAWEIEHFGAISVSDGDDDPDGDGLNNEEEETLGLDPLAEDSDGDGYRDGAEVEAGTNPLDGGSYPRESVLALWTFDGSTSDAITANPGVLQSGAALGTAGSGRSGAAGDQALDLGATNASQRLTVADASALVLAAEDDAFTISFWIRHSQTNAYTGSAFWAISPTSGDGQRGLQSHTPWSDNSLYFDCGHSNSGHRVTAPAGTVNWTAWHHFALVKDGATMQIWLDGVLKGSVVNAVAAPEDFSRLTIGARDGGANSVRGLIDEFAVFDDALDPGQIGDLAGGEDPIQLGAN